MDGGVKQSANYKFLNPLQYYIADGFAPNCSTITLGAYSASTVC